MRSSVRSLIEIELPVVIATIAWMVPPAPPSGKNARVFLNRTSSRSIARRFEHHLSSAPTKKCTN